MPDEPYWNAVLATTVCISGLGFEKLFPVCLENCFLIKLNSLFFTNFATSNVSSSESSNGLFSTKVKASLPFNPK